MSEPSTATRNPSDCPPPPQAAAPTPTLATTPGPDPAGTNPPRDGAAPPTPLDGDGAPAPPTRPTGHIPQPQQPGEARQGQVGDYELLGELGRGGMGVVYRARHRTLKRDVALKMVLAGSHAGPAERQRFLLEAEAVARLRHPNVVQIFEAGEHNGSPWFALEFVEGGSLHARLNATPQPPAEAAALLAVLARAVHAAHQAGIVHRDLKPANVLLARKPDAERFLPVGRVPLDELVPKVTDFGLAKELEGAGQTASGALMGTPCYMAPEQAEGRVHQVGPAADVYALAAVLYEVLTGRPPFKGATAWETLEQVRSREPVAPSRLQPGVPRDLETVCLKGLQKDPRQRYASAEALADDLRRYLDGRPILARPAPAWERAWKWARRRPTQAALAVAVLLFLVAGAAGGVLYGLYRGQQADRREDQLRAQEQKRREAVIRLSELQEKINDAERRGLLEQADGNCEVALAELGRLAGDPDPLTADWAAGLKAAVAGQRERIHKQVGDEKDLQQARQRLQAFATHYEEMAFREISLRTGEEADDLRRLRREAAAALAALGLRLDAGPDTFAADLAPYRDRYLTDQEARRALGSVGDDPRAVFERLAGQCLTALLAWAHAEADEPADDARLNLRLLAAAEAVAVAHGLPVPRALALERARCFDSLRDAAAARAERGRAAALPLRSAVDHFRAGLADYRAGRYPEAAAACEAALRADAGHFWARYLLALCRLRNRQWDVAVAHLSACLAERRDFAHALLLRGMASAELRAYGDAEADFARALELAAGDRSFRADVLISRSASRVGQQRLDDALADLREAIRLKPEAYQAHVNLSQVLRLRNDRDGALKALDEALDLQPGQPALLYTRAFLRLERGEPGEARKDFDAFVEAEPDVHSERLARARLELARLHMKARAYGDALDECDAALRDRPDCADAHRQRAEALLALRQYAAAGAALDEFLKGGQAIAADWVLRGLIHEGRKEYLGAVRAYTLALELRLDARTLALRGWVYLKLEAPLPALADFEAALVLQPASAEALCGRAWARAAQGQLLAAVKDADDAYREGPRTAALLFRLACVHGRLHGHPATAEPQRGVCQERALELLRAAFEEVPEAERPAFWRDHVRNEPCLASLRASTGMLELARKYGR